MRNSSSSIIIYKDYRGKKIIIVYFQIYWSLYLFHFQSLMDINKDHELYVRSFEQIILLRFWYNCQCLSHLIDFYIPIM
jgi:hypothetical protein